MSFAPSSVTRKPSLPSLPCSVESPPRAPVLCKTKKRAPSHRDCVHLSPPSRRRRTRRSRRDVRHMSRASTWTPALEIERDARAVERYARHLVLPRGAALQRALCAARVLVVGCGGLGCPVATYLSANGVGTIALCDADDVELSNLHRQVGHGTSKVGTSKSASLRERCLGLNDGIEIIEHRLFVNQMNANEMVDGFDLVCDCSDNPRTRYVLSDACARRGVPLVSAACVGFEGQLTVLCGTRSWDDERREFGAFTPAPCYRCLFPTPPAAGDAGTCGASGVLGVLPGIVGTFQALEAIKVLSGIGETSRGKMVYFDSLSASPTMTLNMREERDPRCACCSVEKFDQKTYDYDAFLSSTPCPMKFVKTRSINGVDLSAPPAHGPGESLDEELQKHSAWKRLSTDDFQTRSSSTGALIVDVRSKRLFDAAHLRGSVNIPIEMLDEGEWRSIVAEADANVDTVLFVCAGGNNSQRASAWFANSSFRGFREVFDMRGGLAAWRRDVDPSFPKLG